MYDSLGEAPWLRFDNESAKAYEAFTVYRDLGIRRTLRETAEKVGKSASSIEKWSRQHRWVARCAAWAEFRERESRQQQMRAIEEMNDRHIALAQAMLSRATKRLVEIDPAKLTVRDVIDFVALGVKLERQARGAQQMPASTLVVRTETAGRMSRAALASPAVMELSLQLLDRVADAEVEVERLVFP